MNIWVEGHINARSFRPVEPTMAIRVFDWWAIKNAKDEDGAWTNGPAAPFPSELYEDVWSGTISDVHYDAYPSEHRARLMREKNARPFTANMADGLARKIRSTLSRVGALLIHCHAGVSRSVALAYAIDEGFDLKAHWSGGAARFKGEPGYVGNETVYRVMCEAIGRLP